MELLSIGKFAKKVGVNVVTLRRMEKSGELIPFHVSSGGTRYYFIEQLKHFGKTSNENKLVVGYCRVSEPSQKDDLIQIITVFANRLYGQRSKKTKRLIDEVKNNDTSEKDKTKTN